MKKVFFNKIVIKNFLSVGTEPVSLEFQPGVNIITGINKDKSDRRNGVGKSTITDAVYFAIFGTTCRELKKELIPHNLNDKVCEVELSFRVESPRGHDDFLIRRTLRPSKVHIYKNGIDRTLDSISNTNEYICAVLSATPTTIKNCMIMSVNDTTSFMSKKASEKRKFIEDILNLKVFADMLQSVRIDFNKQSKDFEIQMTKINETNNTIKRFRASKQDAIDRSVNRTIDINSKIKDLNDLVSVCEEKLEKLSPINIDNERAMLEKLRDKSASITNVIDKLKNKRWKLNSDIQCNITHINNIINMGDKCPTCSTQYSEESRSESIQTIDRYKNVNESFANDLDIVDSKLTEISETNSKLISAIQSVSNNIQRSNDVNSTIFNLKNNIIAYKNNIIDLNAELSNISNSTEIFDDNIEQSMQELDALQSDLNNIQGIISILEDAKLILNDEGVKTFIINKMLNVFNTTMQYYLNRLDSGIICFFNEFFEEELINEKQKICAYHNFSGAERKSIDIACMFTFNDVRALQSDVSYNLSFYDELFDTSFDSAGVGLVFNVLEERADRFNECIYVISHKRKSAQTASGVVVNLQKVDGVTTRLPDGLSEEA